MEINLETLKNVSALLNAVMVYHVSIVLATDVLNSRVVILLNPTLYELYRAGVFGRRGM